MVNWDDVEAYLKKYVRDFYQIEDSNEVVYIGNDLPEEYTHSNYTRYLRGAQAKAKANAMQAIPEMIEIAENKVFEENKKEKHVRDAKYGWYRYDTRFALPVFDESGILLRYNVFHACLLIRHAGNGKNTYIIF